MYAGVIDEHARAEAAVAPGQARRCPSRGMKPGDFAGADSCVGAAEIAVRVEHRVVRRAAQALEQAGQKRELLLVAELPALHDRPCRRWRDVSMREAGVFAVVAVVRAGRRRCRTSMPVTM